MLWLAGNRIHKLSGLESLAALRELNVAGNPLGGPDAFGWAAGLAPCSARMRSINLAATRMHSILQAGLVMWDCEPVGSAMQNCTCWPVICVLASVSQQPWLLNKQVCARASASMHATRMFPVSWSVCATSAGCVNI